MNNVKQKVNCLENHSIENHQNTFIVYLRKMLDEADDDAVVLLLLEAEDVEERPSVAVVELLLLEADDVERSEAVVAAEVVVVVGLPLLNIEGTEVDLLLLLEATNKA